MGELDATYYIAFLLISRWATDPWGTRTSQALVRGPGWEPPLDFFDSHSQDFSHSGNLGLTDPGCGGIKTRVLQGERQWVSQLPGIKATFSFPFFFSLPPLAEPLPPSISPRVNNKATSVGKGFRVMVMDTAGNQR